MMDWTDRHCRFFLRQLTRHALLHTEMVTTQAVLCGDRSRLLGYHPEEHPLALQLGGSEPVALAECCRIAADMGYDEVNLNVGCPSERVQAGRFGVCLMAETTNKIIIMSEKMAEGGVLPEDLGLECAKLLCEEISKKGCVDRRL